MSEKRATREALGETLIELANEGLPVVAVDADLSGSTTTAKFGKAFPERLFNAGIAEQSMVGTAAGLAVEGMVPFTGSFAVFAAGRAYDQVRNTVCYSNLGVKMTPTHAGITVGPDGGSHQMLEDIALMRVLPNMRVLVPADYVAAKAAIRLAASTPGPFYIRLGRATVPVIYDDSYTLELGQARVLREGVHITLVACGVMVEQALAAAVQLELDGIHAEVLDIASIKPLPAEQIAASARKTGAVVTCEEHSIIGGLGSAVAEALGELAPVPLARMGVRDVFGTSGEPAELMEHFGLTAPHIVRTARELLEKRR